MSNIVSWRKAFLLSQTLTFRKVKNVWDLYTSFHLSRKKERAILKGYPAKIGFEPTTHCNLRCPQCPSGLRSFTRPTGMAERALFESLLEELSPYILYLLLYFQGEPYLNPAIFEFISLAKKHRIFSATSTNGHYLSRENALKTVESGLSELIISVDGTTQEVYEEYRVGGTLERVWEGIRQLVKVRRQLKAINPHIILQFIVFKPNEHQIDEVKMIGKKLGVDEVAIKTAQIYDYERGHSLIPSIEKFSRYKRQPDGTYKIKNRLDNQCWRLWQGAEITWDGKVLPCCFDKDAKYEMGNISGQSFGDIWQGELYQSFRDRLLKSRSMIDICQNCSEGTRIWE